MASKDKILLACVLDTETGGLDPKKCAITQLSCKLIRMDTYEIVGVFDKYIKPYKKKGGIFGKAKKLKTKQEIEQEEQGYYEYQEKAMQVTGLSFDFLEKKGEDINDVASSFLSFVKKCSQGATGGSKPFLVGQNIPFDLGFLQHMFTYTGLMKEFSTVFQGKEDINGNFNPTMMDTLLLSRIVFANDPSITSYKLEAMAGVLGVELVDAHSSMADVDATGDIFVVLVNRMRNGVESNTSDFLKSAEKYRAHFMI